MNLNRFISKYDCRGIEDDCSYTSQQFLAFARDFKSLMHSVAANVGAQLAAFNVGHYDVSGFFVRDGQYAYFSFSVPRGGYPLALQKGKLANYPSQLAKVLVRSAANEKDFVGGPNQFAYLADLEGALDRIFRSPGMEGGAA